jgi:4-hydroxy-tetrahydrodipicolinate synthase
MSKNIVKGLYLPLITPMLYGHFDKDSMLKLIKSVDEYVDGYVPCLSSGEGQIISNEQWKEVVEFIRSQTNKPLFPGIKREKIEDTILLEKIAHELDCDGVTIPVPFKTWNENKVYFDNLLRDTKSQMIIYNTENAFISELENLKELDANERIVAIKDSSMNRDFFAQMCKARLENELSMTVLQGMEHQLDTPSGCDGYLVSLLNIEPKLVKEMLENPTPETNKKILDIFWKYNLGGNWFVTLKALLFERKIINSAEGVSLLVKP